MAHFAKVENGTVTQVIVAEPKFFDTFVDDSPGQWLKTSYNMRGGVYYNPETNEPAADQSIVNDDEGRMRKNYAGIGFTYEAQRDAFIPPQPFASWTLNETSCLWEAPVAYPDDGQRYSWDEDTTNWVVIEEQ